MSNIVFIFNTMPTFIQIPKIYLIKNICQKFFNNMIFFMIEEK